MRRKGKKREREVENMDEYEYGGNQKEAHDG